MVTSTGPSWALDKYREVEAERSRFTKLWKRMQEDQLSYRLAEYTGDSAFPDMLSKGYHTITSNEPKTFANKLIGFASGATRHINIPSAREHEAKRVANQAKKDFILSALKLADKRLKKFVKASHQDGLAFHTAVRGWNAGRCLLIRNPDDGSTSVDITPFDPMNTIWKLGPKGIEWLCHVSYQTYGEMSAKYPNMRHLTISEKESTDRMEVYDYYDDTYNCVFSPAIEWKQRIKHGAPSIPVYVGFMGGDDNESSLENDDDMAFKGESCFAPVRGLYPKLNFVLSAYMQHVAMAMKRSYIYMSQDGTKSLPHDPNLTGQEFRLADGEKVEMLEIAELSKVSPDFLSFLMGAIQRGSLPHSAYGEVLFQLSGYALETLHKGISDKVDPLIAAMAWAYQQIGDKLCEQYITGYFASLSVPGEMDMQNIELVMQADDVEFDLYADMPSDMASKVQMANMMRDGAVPLMDDATLRGQLLRYSDEEGIQNRINEQMAERMIPTAAYLTMFESAMAREKPELAKEYLLEYQMTQMQRQLQMVLLQMQAMQMGVGPGGGMGGGPGAGPGGGPGGGMGGGMGGDPGVGGLAPTASPQASQGTPAPTPFPQAGSLLPPGTPRPAVQSRGAPL